MLYNIVLIILVFLPNPVNAQKTILEIDTVEMQVDISCFTSTDITSPGLKDIVLTNVIIPKSENFDITRLINKRYKSKFNGVFIINDDQLIEHGIIIKRSGEFQTINNPIENKIQFRPLQKKVGNFNYFCGFKVTAVWKKYKIADFEESEKRGKELYDKYATHKKGPYNYYVIQSIKKMEAYYY